MNRADGPARAGCSPRTAAWTKRAQKLRLHRDRAQGLRSAMGRIRVATDFSACSGAVVRLAAALARSQAASPLLLHVVERPPAEVAMLDLGDDERAAIEADLRPAIPTEGAEHGIATHLSVIEALSATDAILAAAERLDVDVIALGSHGRSGLSRALLGSVAEQVARRSRRPVFIVHGEPMKT